MAMGSGTGRISRYRILATGAFAAVAVLAAGCTASPSSHGPASAPAPAAPTSNPPAAPAPGPSAAPLSGPSAASTGTGSSSGTSGLGTPLTVSDNTWTDAVNPAAVPLGDGKISATPRSGYVDSCTRNFTGRGARRVGPWINSAAGTWNSTAKLSVTGHHLWAAANFSVKLTGSTRVITTNDLPVRQPTGTFPISPSDPAYEFDHNPNSIVAHNFVFNLPADPVAAATPSCTGLGPIGVTADGVLLFNALDATGRDAGAHETQDTCHGHPNAQDEYHYHSISECLAKPRPNTSVLVGYALDGYGIYAEWNARGQLPTNSDLDACHGRTSTVLWNGKRKKMYHYDVTLEYPYTVGCFHGTPVRVRPPSQS